MTPILNILQDLFCICKFYTYKFKNKERFIKLKIFNKLSLLFNNIISHFKK